MSSSSPDLTKVETVSRTFLVATWLSSAVVLIGNLFDPWFDFATWHLAWSSVGECLCGSFLVYRLSVLEHRLGSSHYFAFIIVSYAIIFACQYASIVFLKSLNLNFSTVNGPHGVVMALAVRYAREVPTRSKLNIAGLKVTNKWCEYILAAQLAFSSTSSALSVLFGIIIGLMSTFNFFYLREVHIPQVFVPAFKFMCELGSGCLTPSFSGFRSVWNNFDLRSIASSQQPTGSDPSGLRQPASSLGPSGVGTSYPQPGTWASRTGHTLSGNYAAVPAEENASRLNGYPIISPSSFINSPAQGEENDPDVQRAIAMSLESSSRPARH